MSNRFTNLESTEAAVAQPLGQLLINASQWISASLVHLMRQRGHAELTSAHLQFFCSLDCGMTHASNVARRMGISRQAVYKTTKELQRLGVLELLDDPNDGRQKIISMTECGERIVLDARACMMELEQHIAERTGKPELDQMVKTLGQDWGPILGSSDEST